jgi:YD repeat-containing protein
MKKYSFLLILLPFFSLAQDTPAEAKKMHVSSLVMTTFGRDSTKTSTQEVRYDKSGLDTAEYMDGELTKRYTYEYDSKGRVSQKKSYNKEGMEIGKGIFSYDAAGSYYLKSTDVQFGLSDFVYYDKNGRILKTKAPDGSERIYGYNKNGKLASIRSKDKKSGVYINIEYLYGPTGLRTKALSKGDYKWSTVYEYDKKGILKRSLTTSGNDDEVPMTTTLYQYKFW